MNNDGGKEIWDNMWLNAGEIDENIYFRSAVETIINNLKLPISSSRILEAGAGTGTSSLQLAKRGANVTLVDYSEPAIERMKRMFDRNNLEAKFLCNDIRNIQEDDNTYDIAFNSGVFEHFSYEEQVNILKEMRRICKPNGYVIALTPNAKCVFYRLWKWMLESQNNWPYGEEIPVLSMEKQFRDAGLKLIKEHAIDFDSVLDQISSIPQFQSFTQTLKNFYQETYPIEPYLFEGYLLCSIGEEE